MMESDVSRVRGAVMLAALLLLPPAALGQSGGDAERGALLYYQHGCYGCHGFNGYGREPLNHTGSAILQNGEVFRAFLRGRQDQAPLLPSTRMPNYPANALDDRAVADIYAYLRGLPEDDPALEDAPALRAVLESASMPYSKPGP